MLNHAKQELSLSECGWQDAQLNFGALGGTDLHNFLTSLTN